MGTRLRGQKAWLLFIIISILVCSSCARNKSLGYGLLLWDQEDPPIPAGVILPVYIKSNIDKVWVTGVPEQYRREGDMDKFEVPLAQLELEGSRSKAEEKAREFTPYARSYAETLQDGLPIRENPDNGARRVYRLKAGQVVKVLRQVMGQQAISASGDPLPGDWYRVLTEDGVTGYCFSYRLRLFEHSGGSLHAQVQETESSVDADLDKVLTRKWYPEFYGPMTGDGPVDLAALSKGYTFVPGLDSGSARIYTPLADKTISYKRIISEGLRSWRFDGASAPLSMSLRSDDSSLLVQYTDDSGARRSQVFINLPSGIDVIIAQERERRRDLYLKLFQMGPVFSSANYGRLTLGSEVPKGAKGGDARADSLADGSFTWEGYELLVPQVIQPGSGHTGTVEMGLHLSPALREKYQGAFTLRFDNSGSSASFMYSNDTQGLRIEYASPDHIEGETIMSRQAAPIVIFLFIDHGEVGGD